MKHGHVDRRDLQNLLANLEHLRAGGEERNILGEGLAIFAQRLILGAQFFFLPALQESGVELGLLERLRQIIERAETDRFDHGGDLVRAGEHQDVERAIHLHQLAQRFEPVHFRHQYIENDEVGTLAAADARQRFLAAGDRVDVEPVHLEQRLKIFPNTRFVIDDQNLFFVCHRHPYGANCSAHPIPHP